MPPTLVRNDQAYFNLMPRLARIVNLATCEENTAEPARSSSHRMSSPVQRQQHNPPFGWLSFSSIVVESFTRDLVLPYG